MHQYYFYAAYFVLCHILQRSSVLLSTERKFKILVVLTDYPHQD